MKKNARTRSLAFFLTSASGLATLAGCDFTEFKNPFMPDRPPQMVEGERRQPIYNQQMIARVREKSEGVLSEGDNSGIPAAPADFGAPPQPPVDVPPPPGTAGAEDKGFFSGMFSGSEAAAPAPQGAAAPAPAPGAPPAWANSWVGNAPDANAPLNAEQNAPYPSLSSVPPTPTEFETARPRAARITQEMQADHATAAATRATLQGEPSQLSPAMPVEVPSAQPAPTPAPQASIPAEPPQAMPMTPAPAA
ncbi:MAG: hypothetical protein EBV03_05970, partial [Proteobacteria bacterium]|nr:hypothetical protein [Pseudomonadota bacterium]